MIRAVRPAVRLLATLALLAAEPVRANVTGNVEVQSQTTQNVSRPVGGATQSTAMTLLSESLSLHYAGLPFGSSVAIATAGGAFSNVDGWHGGVHTSGQVLSFDASMGFLPRRAVPLRLYVGGSLVGGTSGALATSGAGPSLRYGGSVNLEPGAILPGLRLDVSESRNSRPGQPRLSDVQRRLTASGYQTIGGQRLTLAVRLEGDHREAAGDVTARGATLDWISAVHQTTLLASEVRRSVPSLTGITSDRLLSGTSEQRWAPSLSTHLAGRLSEAGAAGASGKLGDARVAFTWTPVQAVQQLTVSGNAGAGFTRTSSPLSEVSSTSYGGGGRAGYRRTLGPVTGGLAVGASTSSTSGDPATAGTATLLDATVSVALPSSARGSGQAEYTIVRATAPLNRGGNRLENHVRGIGRLALGEASSATASLAYDDGVRELLDITTARAASLHERALTGSLGFSTRLGGIFPSAEVRHARNTVVADGTPFVAGRPRQARSITTVLAGASWSPRDTLGLQAQLIGSQATFDSSPGIFSLGANAALNWRLGRLVASLQYQGNRTRMGDSPSTFQQSIRAVLSRPFEL
ncbi:MAG TPA: hypothetical protein VFI16_04305 [Anaeromyxobacteraceae bacterium]|nr:hypothetical protein [Anaeromyxobacteraceae bacterium]